MPGLSLTKQLQHKFLYIQGLVGSRKERLGTTLSRRHQ